MLYWDASAIVPLVVAEDTSHDLRALAAKSGIVTWALSAVEVASAIERRTREGALDEAARKTALGTLAELRESWIEILAVSPVAARAVRLLATHALRAADALQLAAALVAVEDRPAKHRFVCLDDRLTAAAAREGFDT